MAKTKTEETPVMKARRVAAEKYQAAKSARDKNDNANTQKAEADAREALRVATVAENRERFIRVGGGRMNKAISAIEALNNIANTRSYEFSETDIEKMETALTGALSTAISTLKNAKNKNAKTSEKAGFSF